MRPAILRAYALGIITGGFLTAGIVFAAGPAKADGHLDRDEADYSQTYGPGAICPVVDKYSAQGVVGVIKGIMQDGFTADSAVDIVNDAVATYCPRNWRLLVLMGEAARSRAIA